MMVNNLLLILSGKTNKSILDSYSDAIYINSDELIIRQNYSTLQTLKFSDFTGFNFTNTDIQYDISSKIVFPIIILFLNPIISFY